MHIMCEDIYIFRQHNSLGSTTILICIILVMGQGLVPSPITPGLWVRVQMLLKNVNYRKVASSRLSHFQTTHEGEY